MSFGLLDSLTARHCPHGHGAMGRLNGLWAFHGLVPLGNPGQQAPSYTGNNEVIASVLFVCPTCNLLQAYATEDLRRG